jgi:DNA processing protein
MDERDYWLGFSAVPGIGPKRLERLVQMFGSAEKAWHATKGEKQKVIGDKIGEQLDQFTGDFAIEKYIENLDKKQVQFVTLFDDTYPALLKETDNPPFVLYIKGDVEIVCSTQDDPSTSRRSSNGGSGQARHIGIVGTRKITSYGRDVTAMLTEDLVSHGFCIVSGLAMGVDAVAHMTTVESGGKTIAVLGSGVDVCYPSSNQRIYDAIIQSGGAIVSEYPLGATPSVGSFPSRNRIIAGLSQAVIVTEGAVDSGALITAEDAFRNNRPVFAVPGQITSSLAKGPLSLLQRGAKIATSAQDILKELGVDQKKRAKGVKRDIRGDSDEEQKIIELLQHEPLHVDEIGKRLKLDVVQLSSIISFMELRALLKTDERGTVSLL